MFKGIVGKMFISTTLLLLIFFIFQLVFQNTYLEILYRKNRINTINNELKNFVAQYSTAVNEGDNPGQLVTAYVKEKQSPLLILNENHEVLNEDFFNNFNLLVIRIGERERINLLFDFLGSLYNVAHSELHYGKRILFRGLEIGNTSYFEPLAINFNHNSYPNHTSPLLDDETYYYGIGKEYNGFIVQLKSIGHEKNELKYMNRILYNELLKTLVGKEDLNLFYDNNKDKDIREQFSGDYHRLIAARATINNEQVYFFTLHKFEKISFAFSELYGFYILMYFLVLLVLLLMSFYFSKMLAAPLLYLNTVTRKIAALDFSAKANIKSDDELGELSRNLNILSENLETSIFELKSSNIQILTEASSRAEKEKRTRQLLTNLSHEFKTPLSIISGYLSALEDGINDKEPNYYYAIIQEEIERLSQLINETIAQSKTESGYYTLEYSDFAIGELIDKTAAIFENQLKAKEMLLQVKYPNCQVRGDKRKIEQVMINLVSNALKYSKQKSPLKIEALEISQGEVKITIENESLIDGDEMHKIWDRYYRIEKDGTTPQKGHGIGLEITKTILDLHNSNYGANINENLIYFFFTLPKSSLSGPAC